MPTLSDGVQVFRGFVTADEIVAMSSWILSNINTPLFKDPMHSGTKRLSTRFSNVSELPKEALALQQRIIESFGLTNFKFPSFSHGMYASYGFPGDTCSEHRDPIYHEGHVTYHCNTLLSDIEGGGDVIVDGVTYTLQKGDLMVYPVSHLSHSTTELIGETPRLLWVFGFCIPKSKL